MGKPQKSIEQAAQWAEAKAKRKPKLKNGTNPKAKSVKDVSLPQPRWDQGAMGRANRHNLVTEERGHIDGKTGKKVNPNGVKGVRRVDMIEVYLDRGVITKRGHRAGEYLRDAWAATQKGKGTDWSMERVDSTSKPDANIDIQIDRVSALVSVSRMIDKGDKEILFAICGEGHSIGHLKQYQRANLAAGKRHLRDALDRLADKLGL